MKIRKVLFLFLVLGFGLIIEGINVTRNVLNDESFEGFKGINLDGDFPFRFSPFRGPSHEFTESQTAEAAGIEAIDVQNAFGDVTVRRTTDPKAAGITVGLRKEVFTRRSETAESVADKVKLTLTREGSVLKIASSRGNRTDRVRTHIEIETPAPLDTHVTNRHGRIVVEGAKAVNVSGDYDEMRVTDIAGDCAAKNRHGNVEVISAARGCRVDVEFGDAHVERLAAASTVDVAHGNLSAVDIQALTANLRFADLQARKIAGDLQTQGEHSDLRIEDVKGAVSLKNQGDIDLQNVGGRVQIDNERGHVRLMRAAAGVIIRNTFDTVAASDVAGLLEIVNQHGEIRAQRFSRGAKLETDNEDVDVTDFEGPLNVIAKRGNVAVKPVRKVTSPMDVQVDIGDVHLGLPDSINALIDAAVERGDVTGNVGALRSTEQGKRLLKATVGAGGALLKLRSRLGDIQVSSDDEVAVSEPDLPDAPEIDTRYRAPLGADPLPAMPRAPEPPDAPGAAKAPKSPGVQGTPRAGGAPAAPPAPPAPPVRPSPEGR